MKYVIINYNINAWILAGNYIFFFTEVSLMKWPIPAVKQSHVQRGLSRDAISFMPVASTIPVKFDNEFMLIFTSKRSTKCVDLLWAGFTTIAQWPLTIPVIQGHLQNQQWD